jgi:hypothetical protein
MHSHDPARYTLRRISNLLRQWGCFEILATRLSVTEKVCSPTARDKHLIAHAYLAVRAEFNRAVLQLFTHLKTRVF